MNRALQPAVALVFVLLWCLALTGQALAHIEIERTEPAAGTTLEAPPTEVFLRFTGEVEEGSITIRVQGPDGEDVTDGQTQSGGRAAAVNLAALTANGVYRVRYEGTAADGHPIEGRLRFRLRLADQPAPSPTATASSATEAEAATAAPVPATPTAPASTPNDLTQEPRRVPWWPFALLLGIAALIGVTLFRRS